MPIRSTVAAAMLLLAPTALAAWSLQGSTEPDTPLDTGVYNHLDPDTSAGRDRVYLNAIPIQYGQHLGNVNPNVLPGGRLAPVSLTFVAYLGAWKDCNRDGYVGAAFTSLLEYREELLPDDGVCSPGGLHRPDGWVVEFRWIGPWDKGNLETSYWPKGLLVDNQSAVWGDFGRPGDPPFFACPVQPMPRGTWGSTGGFLQYVDCQNDFAVGHALSEDGPLGPAGLAFDDPRHPEADCDHPLNRPLSPFGDNEGCYRDDSAVLTMDTDRPAFEAWDCSREPVAQVDGDPMADDGDVLQVPWPHTTPAVDPGGSWYDALNGTERGVRGCKPAPSLVSLARIADPARTLESAAVGSVPTDGKRSTDFPMHFFGYGSHDGYRLYLPAMGPASTVVNATYDARDDAIGPPPFHHGLQVLNNARGTGWRVANLKYPAYNPPQYRGATVDGEFNARGRIWFTFYAQVGPGIEAVTHLPPGRGVYGAEACQGATTGVRGGWDCNRDHWWRPDLGGQSTPVGARDVRPGDPYRLRDVDCLDHAPAGGGPVTLNLAAISTDGACPAMEGDLISA